MLSPYYDTSKTQSERALADVQTVMEDAPEIESGTNHINILGLKDASFQIELFAM
jgi:hypothetical protein